MTSKFSIAGAALVFAVVAFAAGGGALAPLGVSENDARGSAVDAFAHGNIWSAPAAAAFKAASPQTRVEFVHAAGNWLKAYASTDEFRAAWDKIRQDHKPDSPDASRTVDDEIAKLRQEQQHQIAEMKKSIEQMPADQRKEMQQAVDAVIAQINATNSDPAAQEALRMSIEAQRTADEQEYERSMKEWEESYPADSRVVIAKRLREFLTVSSSVDFEAKLVSKGGSMRFANPQYEQESSEWKLCYRAGREPVEAAQAFAKAWLAELGR